MIQFDMVGCPAPQGLKKFVGVSKAGRGLMVESLANIKTWRQDVKAAAEAARERLGLALGGALCCSMVFTWRPKN